ncbi:hypothetical protein QFZ31_006720 [Neobacillus niacini]|uniref:hypothetical protein n=1 Tax=Neobacillus driksii TaxID=3035913 RepID=UPI002785F518|nr:hypothetical protein [Neobacillus niacini]MDQ0976668.1 hypothetical protein [Neobacillus niacini]
MEGKFNQEAIKTLLLNYPVKDIRFEYNTIILVLQAGREIEITSEMGSYDESTLSIEHYVIERKQVGRVELD